MAGSSGTTFSNSFTVTLPVAKYRFATSPFRNNHNIPRNDCYTHSDATEEFDGIVFFLCLKD
jgi:hypothetical protein